MAISRGLESESPGVRVLAGVRVSLLKETPTPGPICFIGTYVYFCCSLFDFCAIYFTTKTLLDFDLLLEEFKISIKSSLSTQSLSHSKS